MSYLSRLNKAFQHAPVLPVTPSTRYVFFSDCHRGVGSNNDNFFANRNIYYAALQHYYKSGFRYIEVGDGDELWENRDFDKIRETYETLFGLLSCFHDSGRLYMIYGNHDMIKKKTDPVFPGLQISEGLILHSQEPCINLYVTHGHQADWFNSVLWRVAEFLVRYLWMPLEHFGISDPASAAKNNTKRTRLEQKYLNYAARSNALLLTGHTHKPTLGSLSSPYYNCGCCVHPGCITCIEFSGYTLNLVKWCENSGTDCRFVNMYNQQSPVYPVYIKRELLATETL